MNEDLPSINDFIEDRSNLPSVNDFIKESHTELSERTEVELPSYKDFLEKREPEPQVIQEEVVAEPLVSGTDLSSVITLIEGVRNSIPEVKSYDKELYELMYKIEELRRDIPEFKSYDQEIRELKESIPTVPEVRYYDREIQELRDSIPSVPEVKYYDQDIKELKESISEVKDRYIPDFRWIYKSFSQLDEGQENLDTSLSQMKNRLDMEMSNLLESIEVVKFETGVDTKSLGEKLEGVDSKVDSVQNTLSETVNEVKEKIWKELSSTSLRIWELRKEIKEDDKKFKKELSEQYKELGLTISDIIETSEQNYSDLTTYLNGIKDQIPEVPEVKYYDEEIEQVNKSISSVKNLVDLLEHKLNKKIAGLKESILVVPPDENNTDPLTPLDQNFATLDDLSNHYRLFLNRIQQQLSTLGGGGEVRLEFLDDVDRDTALVDGKVLAYQASTGKFIGVTNSGGGGGSAGIANTSDVRDAIQGYYGYTTDFYTVGVANTTQFVGAGETTMIMPQVAAVYQYMPTVMTDVSTNPYVGSGATIGTGQTEFSLAGLGSGASCIVRTALAFDPDEDNSNLDIQLKFTTNTATQASGLTNFNILKENALIMTVGGEQQYISENLFSFFVGTTLEGTTQEDAGSFRIEVIPSADGDLEVLAVTVSIVA